MRMQFLIIGAVILVAGCGKKEEGLYLDHNTDEVRLDGVVISEDEFAEILVDPTNANWQVTVIRNATVKSLALGEIESAVGVLIDSAMSSQEPELYSQPHGEAMIDGMEGDPHAHPNPDAESGPGE